MYGVHLVMEFRLFDQLVLAIALYLNCIPGRISVWSEHSPLVTNLADGVRKQFANIGMALPFWDRWGC